MGHWEQIGAESRSTRRAPLWEKIAFGIFAFLVTTLIYGLLAAKLWAVL